MDNLVERLAEKWAAWADAQSEMSDEDIVRFFTDAIADELDRAPVEEVSRYVCLASHYLRTQASNSGGGSDE